MNEGRGFWVEDATEDEGLLAPVHYGDGAREEPDEDDPEFWSDDDGGVSDRERIIRVWVEGGRLTRVRISPSWAVKLERRKGATLAGVANTVLQVAHVGVAGPSPVLQEAPRVELTKEFARSLPDANPATLEAMSRHYANKHREFSKALREAVAHQAAAAPVQARSEGVTVMLNGRGQATSLTIDEAWLGGAHAGGISAAIMTAARGAYEQYAAAPSPEVAVIHEVAREYDYLGKVMNAILVPRDRR